ncbi:Somatostatin-1, partial [Dissostichus eleginoides]
RRKTTKNGNYNDRRSKTDAEGNTTRDELSRASLAELLLSDLLQENEALEEDGFPAAGEPENIRLDLDRAAAAGPLLTPRERKAGCKNFFWKTFTSC